MVVGWGRWGRTVTQTQVLRAGVPWSSRAGLRGSTRKALGRPHQSLRSSAGAPIFHTLRVRDCQRYCVSRLLWVYCR